MNYKIPEPQLADLLIQFKKDIYLGLNCHAIATVQSFDSSNQTVVATINYTKTFLQRNTETGTYEKVQTDYPILLDVPVVVIRGGQAGLTMPILKGDQCLILFNDRSIDQWFQSGQVGPVASSRLHDLSDGIALVGLSNLNNPIQNYDSTRASLYNGTTKVAVGAEKILLSNDVTTLNTLIVTLIDTIKALTVGGAPIDAPGVAALEALKTQFGGLLE